MPPFNGHPEGFSAATLKLLDEGLHRMWLDTQSAPEAKKESVQHAHVVTPLDQDAINRGKQE